MHLAAFAALAGLVVALFAVVHHASAAPSLTVSIGDSDNIVKAGTTHNITIQVKGGLAGADYDIDYITAEAGVVLSGTTLTNIDLSTNTGADGSDNEGAHANPVDTTVDLVVPNHASGPYTINVRVSSGTSVIAGELTVTVGDVGTGIGSVEVSLGKVGHSTAKNAATDKATAGQYGTSTGATYANCVDSDTGTDGAQPLSTCIAVTVSVKNSLGAAANPGDVSTIHVFAPLGVVLVGATPDTNQTADARGEGTISIGEDTTDTTDGVNATTKFFILKDEAGTVDVTAIVLGSGSATSTPLTLTFTGAADTISLGDPSSPLSQNGTAYAAATDPDGTPGNADDTEEVMSEGEATIEVTATDKSGNTAALTAQVDADGDGDFTDTGDVEGDLSASNVAIVDADDDDVSTISATVTQKKDKAGDNIPTAVIITLNGTDAEPGEYTVRVTFGDNDPVEATIVVAGAAANVDLATEWDENDILTVTATVTDKGGNLLPDKETLHFDAVGGLDLRALGTGADGGMINLEIDDGVAKARFAAIKDSGTAKIIVTASNGVNGVAKVSLGEAEEAAPEVVSLDCLSSLTGFSSYTCSMGSTASELFGLVSSRGATAIHLWNGSMWVRYAVVDGNEIPGSSDFSVTEDDILYISN